MSIEAGPKPVSTLPWKLTKEPDGARFIDATGAEVFFSARYAARIDWDELPVILHRCNNWDALIAERDALAAEVEELKARYRVHQENCQCVVCK